MRFTELSISNFKAIRNFKVANLSDFVLIAGPNGCGKSCVFDAIRLLKSVYGGYEYNEWQRWFGEFQIDLNNPDQVVRLFRDPSVPISISATVQLSASEKDFLQENAETVVAPLAWASVTGQPIDSTNYSQLGIATQFRQFGERAQQAITSMAATLRSSLSQSSFELALTIQPNLSLVPSPNPTMEVVFQTYKPEHLGVIEYHSASRTYQRENIGGINLDTRETTSQRKQHMLYDWQQKYSNIKNQLAATFVREAIASATGIETTTSDLNDTLKELFQTFFPDKEYLGVKPDSRGALNFPVRTKGGQEHDINELSSGEKEVLYGYLSLRNSTPQHSTLLLDEPELHLNPGLLRGFPDFYHRNLGKARSNQLWLVTHSDTLLRQAVGNANYSVFHMTTADGPQAPDNQAVQILAQDALERATIDLVGDLAMYRPKGKVVLFEGGGDTDTDIRITERLFPVFAKDINLVSGGSKQRVRDLYDVLTTTAEQVGMAGRFFAVTDKDSAPWESPPPGARQLQWDAYHIENYLLEPKYVREAVAALVDNPRFVDADQVLDALRAAAAEVLPELVVIGLRKLVNNQIVRSVHLGGNPNSANAANALIDSVTATFTRLDSLRSSIDLPYLESQAAAIENGFRQALADGSWLKEFPGRSILQKFVSKELAGKATYEGFRNLIVDQMVDDGYEPPGMRQVLDIIMAAEVPLD